MKKEAVVILLALACMCFFVSNVQADAAKGQKIFLKKLKEPCGMNGGQMAVKHTQVEWKELNDAGKLNEEFLKLCPTAEPLKDSYLQHVYDFLYNYASDSGNVPAC